jgi:hypothetical protein
MTTTPPDGPDDKTGEDSTGSTGDAGRRASFGVEPTTGETYNDLATRLAGPVNTAELALVAFLATIDPHARASTAQAVRRRGPAEAHRYTHAADIAVRMPDLFARMAADGRHSVEHLDALWRRINRHAAALARTGEALPGDIDAAVAAAVTGWEELWGAAGIDALADIADEVLTGQAPVSAAQTEQAEAQAVGLTRRGTRLILECGDPVVADGVWEQVGKAALDVRGELITEAQQQQEQHTGEADGGEDPELARARETVAAVTGTAAAGAGGVMPPPGMARCRGEAVLGILGGRRRQLSVTVNVYTPDPGTDPDPGSAPGPSGPDTSGPGPDSGPDAGPAGPIRPTPPAPPAAPAGSCGYVVGTGWVSPAMATVLTETAARVRVLPGVGAVADTAAYPFTTVQRAVVVGRDARCRFPGCRIPADACEFDHIVNSPHTDPDSDGVTGVSNCACLCATHHRLKTRKLWRVHTPDGGVTLHWAGPEGVAVSTVACGPLSPVRGSPA